MLSNYVVKVKSYHKVLKAILDGERSLEKLVALVHGRILNKHGRNTIKGAVTGSFSDINLIVFRQTKEIIIISWRTRSRRARRE